MNWEPPELNTGALARMSLRNAMLEVVFNAIEDGVIVIDTKTYIRYFNRSAGDLLGIPADPQNPLRISQFIKELPWAQFMTKGNNSSYRCEVEILYPCYRNLQLSMLPLEKRNESVIILRDVTQQRDESQRYIESEKLRMVSLLAAGVAHEIGNPLNSIYLNLQLLQRELNAESPDLEDFKSMVEVSKREVERLDGIITRFLAALRPTKPNFAPVNLRNLILKVLESLRSEIENYGVHVTMNCAIVLPQINADATQITQVLVNLIKNALQATPRDGKIEIRCYENDDNFLVCEVADTGSGISGEDVGRLFDPFHTTKQTGTGLGLFIAERTLREHGGSISVESEKGMGSTFTLKFPLQGRIRTRQLATADAPPPFPNETPLS